MTTKTPKPKEKVVEYHYFSIHEMIELLQRQTYNARDTEYNSSDKVTLTFEYLPDDIGNKAHVRLTISPRS